MEEKPVKLTKAPEVVVHEREWDSEGLTFYQAKVQGRSGLIYERTIAYHRYGGGPSRSSVREEVRVAAEVDGAGRAYPAAATA